MSPFSSTFPPPSSYPLLTPYYELAPLYALSFSSLPSLTDSDGSPQSLVSSTIIGILLFSATLYISLDTSQQWTNTFTLGDDLIAKTLFVLTLIWPALYVFYLSLLTIHIVKDILANSPAHGLHS